MNHAAEHEIAKLLARYLCENPNACDGVQGISRWWLPAGHSHSDADVERALELLVSRDVVESSRAADGRVRYALRSGRFEAAVSFCQGGE